MLMRDASHGFQIGPQQAYLVPVLWQRRPRHDDAQDGVSLRRGVPSIEGRGTQLVAHFADATIREYLWYPVKPNHVGPDNSGRRYDHAQDIPPSHLVVMTDRIGVFCSNLRDFGLAGYAAAVEILDPALIDTPAFEGLDA